MENYVLLIWILYYFINNTFVYIKVDYNQYFKYYKDLTNYFTDESKTEA